MSRLLYLFTRVILESRGAKLWLLAIVIAYPVLAFTAGCGGKKSISTRSPEPIKAEFDSENSRVVEQRYLVVPVRARIKEDAASSVVNAYTFSQSAWSGLGLASSGDEYPDRPCLNLKIVDLKTKTESLVFDRQVALASWEESLESFDSDSLRFKDILLLSARAEDTSADRKIDVRDHRSVYAYDLAEKKLFRLSPEGYDVSRIAIVEKQLVFTLLASNGELSVYECNPLTEQGSFLARDMSAKQ